MSPRNLQTKGILSPQTGSINQRVQSLEPQQTTANKNSFQVNQPNTARGMSNDQNLVTMNQAYLTNNNFVAQLSQRKSRGKPTGQSVEPSSIISMPIDGSVPHQ